MQNLGALKFFLEKSDSRFVQFASASALKRLFTEHWLKIPVADKLSIKDFVVNFLVQKESSLDN